MGKGNELISSYFKPRRNTNVKKKVDPTTEMALSLPDIIDHAACWKAYRLNETSAPCKDAHSLPHPKTKNCRQIPYCLYRLGLEKFDKLKKQCNDDSASQTLTKRDVKKQPCGLVNSGNYCYVNSFLQIWFNDLIFRQCIYDWRPSNEFVKPEDTKFDVQAVMNCLQELFVTMQFTPYPHTTANAFIQLLMLNNEQHDVQEFHTLFFDVLDRNLAFHPNGQTIRDVLRHRFESRICQTTSCECGQENINESEYRSLQISIPDDAKNLTGAIQAFFYPEQLADYKCETCGESGQVTRYCNFSKLPEVLIIQLNRYIFDANGRHKKLKTPIQYPRTLPERVLKQDSPSAESYELCAVMIHEGQNTHCGHYYDLVKDPSSDQWYSYNDKEVSPIKAPGVVTEKEAGAGRATSDMKGCYALIYHRSAAATPTASNSRISLANLRLPPDQEVQRVCTKVEAEFVKETKEGNRSWKLWSNRIEQRHTFLNDLWTELEVTDGSAYMACPEEIAFLPTSLLQDLLSKEHHAVEEQRNLDGTLPPKEITVLGESTPKSDEKMNGNTAAEKRRPITASPATAAGAIPEARTPPSSPARKRLRVDASGHLTTTPAVDETNVTVRRKIERVPGVPWSPASPQNPQELAFLDDDKENGYEHLPAMANEADDENEYEQLPAMADDDAMDATPTPVPAEPAPKPLLSTSQLSTSQLQLPTSPLSTSQQSFDERNFGYYAPEPVDETMLTLCAHGRVPLDAVHKGELKAVRVTAARRLLDEYGAKLRIVLPSAENDGSGKSTTEEPAKNNGGTVEATEKTLLTGADLCVECVKDTKFEAVFNVTLDETMDSLVKELLRDAKNRTYDPSRTKSPVDPPIDSVWVSLAHLRSFKKIATQQMQRSGRLSSKRLLKDAAEDAATAANDRETSPPKEEERCQNEDPYEFPGKRDPVLGLDGLEEVPGESEPTSSNSPAEAEEGGGADRETRFNDELTCCHDSLNPRAKRIWVTQREWDELARNFDGLPYPFHHSGPECTQCLEETEMIGDIRRVCLDQYNMIKSSLEKLLKELEKRRTSWKTDNSDELGITFTRVLCSKFLQKFKSKSKVVEVPPICQRCLLCEHGSPYLMLGSDDAEGHPTGVPITEDEWNQILNTYARYAGGLEPPEELSLTAEGTYLVFCGECCQAHNFAKEQERYIYENADIHVKQKGDESEEQSSAKESMAPSMSKIVTRRLASKNVIKIKMNSTDKVINLKVRLYEKTKQSPADQLLYLGDVALDNELTLCEARVPSNNSDTPLTLIVQQRRSSGTAVDGDSDITDGDLFAQPRALEKGFRDTALS